MQHSSGMSLIEIFISLFLFSIMLLELDAMQLNTLHRMKENYFFSLAAQQLFNMEERLMIYKKNFNEQIVAWNKENQELLPQGHGEVNLKNTNYVLSIFWDGNKQECNESQPNFHGCLQYVQPKLQ